MKTRTFASIAVMSALGLLVPIHSHAFGLGKIELSSALNQPFQAEIAVTALKPDDEGKLQVQLATRAEFDKAGVERSYLLTQLKFEVVENKGEAKILISSTQPVKEPFIDFLLTATTGSGRLIREYTVLLDPPKNVFVKPQVAPAPESKKKVVTEKKTSIPKKTTYPDPDPEMPAQVTNRYSSATSYGPVGRSDTLWVIAKNTKPSSVISQNQMMMAILNANKTSFRHGNINGLKAGYTLDIPSIDDIQALSKKQANAVVAEQNNFWKNRNKVATPVSTVVEPVDMPVAAVDADTTENMEAIEPQIAPMSDEKNTARLQLVSPTDEERSEMDELSPIGNKELTQLSEQLTLAQETIESQSQENLDITARMDLMEEQLQTLRKLITLKDADLARLQSSLGDNDANELEKVGDEGAEADLRTDVEAVETDVAEPIVEPALSDMSEVDAYFSQLEEAQAESGSASDEDTNIALESLDEQSEAESTPLPSEVADNFVDTAIEKVKTFYAGNKQESLIAGFAVALLALIALLFRARGRKTDSDWDDAAPSGTAVTVGGAHSVTDTEEPKYTAPEEPQVTVSEDVEVTVSEQPEVVVSEKVEPATETITDEELIKAAYASLEDDEASREKSADELVLADLSEPDLSAENEDIDVLMSDEESTIEFNMDDFSMDVESEAIVEEKEESTAEPDDLLDFNIENSSNTEIESDRLSLESEELNDKTLDFGDSLTLDTDDLNELTLDDEPLSLDINADLEEIELDDSPLDLELTAADEDSLDLDLTVTDDVDDDLLIDLDLDSELSDLSLDTDEASEFSEINLDDLANSLTDPVEDEAGKGSEVEFDLGDFDEIDEAETKLDLAGAYMDMEDPEGARSILEEVLVDGNDEQKSRAQALLDDLS
ncbi:MAG: hypothetical protein GQ547_02955 [Methylophaga sp.]|nr:hypothetical protein [Methylophaga sp.]